MQVLPEKSIKEEDEVNMIVIRQEKPLMTDSMAWILKKSLRNRGINQNDME